MKRIVSLLFFIAGCGLLTLAVASFGAVVAIRPSTPADPFDWKPPMTLVDQRALAGETIVLPLTGMESADVLSAMLDRAHLENAFALLAYDPNLSDPVRIGGYLQLGTRYTTAKNNAQAAVCYQNAAVLATLSPALSDVARLDTYQQASLGLRAINAHDAARFIADQAYILAQNSIALARSVRVRRLEQIADAYTALGATELATQARGKSVEAASSVDPVLPVRVPFAPAGKLPASPQVEVAKKTRIAAAQQLADDLQASQGKDWSVDSLAQLSDALMNEDDARRTYYDNQIAQATDNAVLIALWRDKIQWLALKYRVARGAFAKTLVAEWSKDPATVAEDWSEAWSALFQLYQAEAERVVSPRNPSQAQEDVLRQELIATRWGWYANGSEPEMRAALNSVTKELMGTSTSLMHLDTLTKNGKTMYWLVPDELYGKGEKALPK